MINAETVFAELNRRGYICERTLCDELLLSIGSQPGKMHGAFICAPPSCGKTTLLKTLAVVLDARLLHKIMVADSVEDELFYEVMPAEDTVSGVRLVKNILPQIIEAVRGTRGRVMAVLDGWDVTKSSCDALLLDFLQSGRMRGFDQELHLSAEEIDRLTTFVVLSGRREISEFLLRRLPVISIEQLAPEVVEKALQHSHPDHFLIPHLSLLYKLSVEEPEVGRPFGLTELRALIDAFEFMAAQRFEPKLETLIQQYLTKDPEKKKTLAQLGFKFDAVQNEIHARLLPDLLDQPNGAMTWRERNKLAERLGFNFQIASSNLAPDDEQVFAVLKFSNEVHTLVAQLAGEPADDPGTIGDLARVVKDREQIIFLKPLLLRDYARLDAFWGVAQGEVVLIEPLALREDVQWLTNFGLNLEVDDDTVIQGRSKGIELRWTAEKGAEIIVDLSAVVRPKLQGRDQSGPLDMTVPPPVIAQPITALQAIRLVSQTEDAWWSATSGRSRIKDPRTYILPRPRDPRLGAYTVPLMEELPPAVIVFEADTREVAVNARVYLPCRPMVFVPNTTGIPSLPGRADASPSYVLHSELCFGYRLTLFGHPLFPTWGDTSLDREIAADHYKFRLITVSGFSWESALQSAVETVFEELDRLVRAMRERALARNRE
jgi:hypothetical protein